MSAIDSDSTVHVRTSRSASYTLQSTLVTGCTVKFKMQRSRPVQNKTEIRDKNSNKLSLGKYLKQSGTIYNSLICLLSIFNTLS